MGPCRNEQCAGNTLSGLNRHGFFPTSKIRPYRHETTAQLTFHPSDGEIRRLNWRGFVRWRGWRAILFTAEERAGHAGSTTTILREPGHVYPRNVFAKTTPVTNNMLTIISLYSSLDQHVQSGASPWQRPFIQINNCNSKTKGVGQMFLVAGQHGVPAPGL